MSPTVAHPQVGEYSGTEQLHLLEAVMRNYNRSIVDEIVRFAPCSARVLDFGAGIGTLPRGARARGLVIDCVELDDGQRARLESEGFSCFREISQVPSGAYDYIYSSNVLEHIADDCAALRELRRVLAPGGQLLLYVPAFNTLFSINDEVVGHQRRYTIPVLRERLRQSGFAVEHIRYADLLGFFVAYLFKLVSNKMESFNPRTASFYDAMVFPLSCRIEAFLRIPLGKNIYALGRRVETDAGENRTRADRACSTT